ncbi:MAG: hypothetical protein JOZ38_02755 [Candidatus Eremiobacteraeota bacterium]|nr:hypothetical protein [Candidatus Eremiobacteraeota bacterium]
MNQLQFEHIITIIGAIVVFLAASVALKNDWKTPGLENQVFKLMLFLLAVGSVLAFLAAMGVIGSWKGSA